MPKLHYLFFIHPVSEDETTINTVEIFVIYIIIHSEVIEY